MHACLFLRVSCEGGFEAHLATFQGMLGGVLNVAHLLHPVCKELKRF